MATGDGGGDFGFPFTPYASQQTLMRGLHEVLEESNVAVFESPTGTGKSLSVICNTPQSLATILIPF
jgi:chromosome transmission fidelity protein 1